MSWQLSITEQEFSEMYPTGDIELFNSSPSNEEELWSKYMPSKLWRLNNLYTITNKNGDLIRFRMNWAQHKAYSATLIHPRIVILKSRQQGISTLWLVSFFDDAITQDNFEIGLMNLGLKESKVLFRRIKRLWAELPEFIKSYMMLSLIKETQDELGFNNGSMMYLSSSFRSGTLQRLHISEFGKIAAKFPEKAVETKTGSLQAIKVGNTVVVESTAEGRANAFYDMWYDSINYVGVRSGKDFMPVFLSWTDDPDCRMDIPQRITDEAKEYFIRTEETLGIVLSDNQKWWWVSQSRELGDKMGQEYPATPEEAFAAVRDGAYFAVIYREEVESRGRVIDDLYDQALKVEVAMDLGVNDMMVLVFFQRYGKEVRLINEYHNSGEGLAHYVGVMNDMARKLGYRYGSVWLPHDAKVRELGSGQTRLARLKELGVRGRVLKRSDVSTGIEQVRRMLENTYIDPKTCGYLIKTFFNYSKQWNDVLGVWSDKPYHNEWSNPADAIRYVAMSLRGGSEMGPSESGKSRRVSSNVVDGMAL